MSEDRQQCVCGSDPPKEPNVDCERCGFIVRIAELERERDILISMLPRQLIVFVRKQLEKDRP